MNRDLEALGHRTRAVASCLATAISLIVGLWPCPAGAEPSPLGRGAALNGAPGVVRTLGGAPAAPGSWTIAANGFYSYAPDVFSSYPSSPSEGEIIGDVTHRSGVRLSLAYAPWRFLQVLLSIEQNVALYSGCAYDEDVQDCVRGANDEVSGAVGDPRIAIRTGWDLGSSFAIGGQLELWIPSSMGGEAQFGQTLSFAVDLALSFLPERFPLGVHLQLGYHANRTGGFIDSLEDPEREGGPIFLPAKTLVLSQVTTDMHHLVAGFAAEYRLGPVAPYVELTADLPLANMGRSSLLVGAGARLWLGPQDAVQIFAGVELGALSGGPGDVSPDDSSSDAQGLQVSVAQPLVAAMVGLNVRLPVRQASAAGGAMERLDVEAGGPAPGGVERAEPGRISGRVLCGSEPCGGETTVEVSDSGASPFLVDADSGAFTTAALAPGSYRVVARTPGLDPLTQEVAVAEGATAEATFTFVPAAARTGIRGRVTDFNGQPLQARVRIPDLDVELESDADGNWEVEAPPGAYQVMIWAEGYSTQTTRVEVTRGGVVVMNVELRQRRRR